MTDGSNRLRRIISAFFVALAVLGALIVTQRTPSAAIVVGTGTKIAYTSNATSITSSTINTTSCTPTCAYAILVCADDNSGTAPTDTQGNVYAGTTESGTEFARLWIALNATTSASYAYTLHSGAGGHLSSIMIPIRGVKAASALDQDTTPQALGAPDTAIDTLTLTPSEAGTILLGGSCDQFSARTHTGDIPAGGGIFTEVDEYSAYSTGFNMGMSFYYEIQTGLTARALRVQFSATQDSAAVVLVNLKMQPRGLPYMLGSGFRE